MKIRCNIEPYAGIKRVDTIDVPIVKARGYTKNDVLYLTVHFQTFYYLWFLTWKVMYEGDQKERFAKQMQILRFALLNNPDLCLWAFPVHGRAMGWKLKREYENEWLTATPLHLCTLFFYLVDGKPRKKQIVKDADNRDYYRGLIRKVNAALYKEYPREGGDTDTDDDTDVINNVLTDTAPINKNHLSQIFNPLHKTNRIEEMARVAEDAALQKSTLPPMLSDFEKMAFCFVIWRARENFKLQAERLAQGKQPLKQTGKFTYTEVKKAFDYAPAAEINKELAAAFDALVTKPITIVTKNGNAYTGTVLARGLNLKSKVKTYFINTWIYADIGILERLTQYYDVPKLTQGKQTAPDVFRYKGGDNMALLALELIRERPLYAKEENTFTFSNIAARCAFDVKASKDWRRGLARALLAHGYKMEINPENTNEFIINPVAK